MKRFFLFSLSIIFFFGGMNFGFAISSNNDEIEEAHRKIAEKQNEIEVKEREYEIEKSLYMQEVQSLQTCRTTYCKKQTNYTSLLEEYICPPLNYVDPNSKKHCDEHLEKLVQIEKQKLSPLNKELASLREQLKKLEDEYFIISGRKTPFTLKDALGNVSALGTGSGETGGKIEIPRYLPGTQDQYFKGHAADATALFQTIAGGITALAGGIAVFFIVLSGTKIILAFGKTDKIAKAKKTLYWSILGLLVIIFAYIAVKTIISLTYSGQDLKYFSPEMQRQQNP